MKSEIFTILFFLSLSLPISDARPLTQTGQLSDQEKRLLYILEYLDGYHSDKEGAQDCANEYCKELVKTTGRRICEGPLPRYPKF